jgi:hypothetical protein
MSYTPELGRRFWFELDKKTLYTPSFMDVISRAGAGMIQTVFSDTRIAGTYPAAFLQFVQPKKADWSLLADTQKSTVDAVLGSDWSDIQAAFEDFGQGTLLDTDPERAMRRDWIHTMDVRGAGPPIGYHRWHASVRAIQLLGIGDKAWWENLDRMIGLAWGIQSFARPKQRNLANPPIAQTELQALRDAWLPLDPDRRDRQYDLTGDVGYHPTPKQPVA